MGTHVPVPALWHCNGAGIGFPQRSHKAEARYLAKVLPTGEPREQGGNNIAADTNPPEDQETLSKGLRSHSGWGGFYHASSCDKKRVICKKGLLCPSVAKARLI